MKRQEFHDPNFEQKKMCVIFPMFRFVFCPLIIQHNSCSMGYFSFAFIPTFRSRKKKLVYSNEVTCEYRSHMQICQLSAVRYVSPTEYSYVLCVFLLVLLHFMCVWALFFLVLIRLNICKCAYWHRLWRVHQAVERGVADFRGNAMQKLHCILFSFEIERHKKRDSKKRNPHTFR